MKAKLTLSFPFPIFNPTTCNIKTGQMTTQADNDIKGNKKNSETFWLINIS